MQHVELAGCLGEVGDVSGKFAQTTIFFSSYLNYTRPLLSTDDKD
jgi:hypothetical protein